MMQNLIDTQTILSLHRQSILTWKAFGLKLKHQDFYGLIEENHAFNYQLWHAEDRARRDDKGYEFVYHAKREIDCFNQQRNDKMEAIDAWLFKALNPAKPQQCAVNSESPGMIIDRLSILSLKSYHMSLQTLREDVEETHRVSCVAKLDIIHQQLDQLALCLTQFLDEIVRGSRSFRVYHQLKMYNDPLLNPELYASK